MKRRGFLKFLGLAAAAPLAAQIPAATESKPVRAHKPITESAWETERNIRAEMSGGTLSVTFLPGWNIQEAQEKFILKIRSEDSARELLEPKS
jgi:hypothetical protein